MKLALDLDGILVDFCNGCFEAYDQPKIPLDEWPAVDNPEGLVQTFVQQVLKVDSDDLFTVIDHQGFWANLDWMPDGQEILAYVEKKFGKENILLATSPPTWHPKSCPSALAGKFRWIEKHMPDYIDRVLFGSPKHWLANDRTVLVDDFDFNIKKFEKAGGYGALMPRPWNSLRHIRDNPIDALKDRIESILL